MAGQNKSIIAEALEDYKEIVLAAENKAKQKLSEEHSDKFNKLVKEELNKNKKQSYQKIDENKESETPDNKEESNMKKEETKKVKKETSEKEEKLNENIVDTNPMDDDNSKSIEDIDRELSEINELIDDENVESNELPAETEKQIPTEYEEKLLTIKKLVDNLLGDSDENVENIDAVGDETENIGDSGDEENSYNLTDDEISEIFNSDVEDTELNDKDINVDDINVDDFQDDEIEEGHGVSYSSRRNASGRNIPQNDYLSSVEKDQAPYLAESKKKIDALIKENKELTKKLNSIKSINESKNIIVGKYRDVVEKMKTQLQEMAVINTNIVNVNNLILNENLAFTQNDKVKLVNEFKNIKTITESKAKYNSILTENKSDNSKNTETIKEKIEIKESISKSSKDLTSINESTAYSDGVKKIKDMIQKIESKK